MLLAYTRNIPYLNAYYKELAVFINHFAFGHYGYCDNFTTNTCLHRITYSAKFWQGKILAKVLLKDFWRGKFLAKIPW